MTTFDKLYEEIEDLLHKVDNTYYDSELTMSDVKLKVDEIYILLEQYDEERDSEKY